MLIGHASAPGTWAHGWRDVITVELRQAVGTGEIAQLDADLAAFQLDAVLVAANTALRLGGVSLTGP